MNFQQTSPKLAWYGAIVATLVALVQIIAFIRNRPSLKVSGYRINIKNGKNSLGKIHIVVHNHGRRSVTILNAGLILDKKPSIITDITSKGAKGPVYLSDNRAIYYEMPGSTIDAHEKRHNQNVTGVFCEIAGGKIYKGKFKSRVS